MDQARKNLAGRLRAAREMAGLSQAQVAAKLGLHRPSVTEIEAGRRRVAAEELASMASLYAVSEAWLLGSVPEELPMDDERVTLAARELARLAPDDLEKLLRLLAAFRRHKSEAT